MYRRSNYNGRSLQQNDAGDYERLADFLGWFSIGLGIAEIVAPRALAKLTGLPDNGRTEALLRSPIYGLREVAAGVGILSQSERAPWLWGRVTGDVLDLGSLATALASDQTNKKRAAFGIAAVLGVTALDILCAQKLSRAESANADVKLPQTTALTIINKSPEEVYAFWRSFENLPRFMSHLESVQATANGRTRWKARGPAGTSTEWEAEIIEDQPNRLISWASVGEAQIPNSGKVTFEPGPGGKGTILKAELSFEPPGGALGASVADFFGKDIGRVLEEDLRALKQIMETGEIMKSDASIHRTMHAARPPVGGEPTLMDRVLNERLHSAHPGQSYRTEREYA